MTDLPSTGHTNFFSRFWHGEYSLPFSYWVVSFLGNLILIAVLGVMAAAFQGTDFNPYSLAGYLVLVWLLLIGWSVFHLVGVWRSATRYRLEKRQQNKSAVWGILAQIALILGGINLVAQVLKDGVPQLRETWRVAFENDPSIPDYTIRVMRNGTELEIAGGFKYGLAGDVAKVLQASPQVKVVHLNSIGGRVGEAKKLARLIREKGLDTYTSRQCASACTIAFAAGRQRWIRTAAKLGFHRGSFAGQEFSDALRTAMLEVGYERAFVDRAMTYPSDKMWYPSAAELQAAHVVSGVVDNYRFAASGYGIRPGTEDFAGELRKEPLFRAMEQADSGAFIALASQYQRRYLEGVPEGTIIDDIRERTMLPLIRARLPLADSQTLIDYAKLIADQYEALGSVDAKACYAYAARGESGKVLELLGADLRQREVRLSERILAATPTQRATAGKQQLEALYRKVFDKLIKRYDEADLRLLLESDKVRPHQYAAYCRIATAMFREIAQLPAAEAVSLLYAMFKELSAETK
jgi:hypothetical protein